MRNFIKYIFCIVLFSSISNGSFAQFYSGYDMQFGKNRVQYDDRFWSFMKFKNFDTYYYLGGLDLAAYVGRTAENDLAEIEKLFDFKLDGKIQFIISKRNVPHKQHPFRKGDLSSNIF